DEIGIDDSSRYPSDEFLHEDDPSRQYQVDSDISYYVIPHGRSLTELTQENHVPEVIVLNEHDVPLTEEIEDPSDLINTKGTHEQNDRWLRDQHIELVNIIGNPGEGMLTRSMAASASEFLFVDFLSEIEPKKEEGIEYDETFAPVAKMKSIKIFLAFATYMNFKFYQMDVKSVFLNDKLKEEVYVKHPLGFESSEFLDYVYKLDKALYGLKQAPRACLICKILVQSKGITSNSCEKNPQIPESMDRKSTSGACQILGGKLICWSAKKQQSVSMSSGEAEYVTAAGCCAKGLSVSTLPKSHRLEASGVLSKKRTKPKSKRPPTKTKESPLKPTKGSEQSHPGTRKSQPLPESTVTPPKDSGGNDQPLDRDLTFITSDEGLAKTTPRPEGSRKDKDSGGNKPPTDMEPLHTDLSGTDEAHESDEEVLAAGDDINEDPQDDKEVRTPSSKQDQLAPSHVQESASNSSSPDLKRFNNILPQRQLIRDLTDKLIEAFMSSLNRSSTTINDLYKGLNVITQLLKEISNTVKDDPATNQNINEATKTFARISSHVTEDKEEQIKKVMKEARRNAISNTEVIKVVYEEVKKLGIHPKEAISTKVGELCKKAHDAEHEVLNRQRNKKVRKSLELRKHKYDSYIWTASNRLKPEPITNIKIYPKTKLVVITVYRGIDGRNFDVHKQFLFGAFGISKLDELRKIISKKKNTMSALLAPEQASSQTSKRKQKQIELKLETRIPRLECNRTLPENVSFVNNMVIEEHEYGIFFTDEFGDQAFQRWSDIDKVEMEALVSYLVAVSMISLLKMHGST
nr:retrovirus-related Pol polyprotein from transposon TNT 1-94 [Tanacetum cinerariifolium]